MAKLTTVYKKECWAQVERVQQEVEFILAHSTTQTLMELFEADGYTLSDTTLVQNTDEVSIIMHLRPRFELELCRHPDAAKKLWFGLTDDCVGNYYLWKEIYSAGDINPEEGLRVIGCYLLQIKLEEHPDTRELKAVIENHGYEYLKSRIKITYQPVLVIDFVNEAGDALFMEADVTTRDGQDVIVYDLADGIQTHIEALPYPEFLKQLKQYFDGNN